MMATNMAMAANQRDHIRRCDLCIGGDYAAVGLPPEGGQGATPVVAPLPPFSQHALAQDAGAGYCVFWLCADHLGELCKVDGAARQAGRRHYAHGETGTARYLHKRGTPTIADGSGKGAYQRVVDALDGMRWMGTKKKEAMRRAVAERGQQRL